MFITTDLNSQIISILKDYGAVPLDFLAKRLRKQRSEITDNIKDLSQKQILEIKGEEVSLKKDA